MKKKLLYLLLLLMSVGATSYAAAPTKIVFTWTDNFTNVQACTATVTTSCIQSFTLTESTTGFSQSITALNGTPSTTFTYTQTTLPAAGTYTYSIVAVEVYSGGTMTSGPATATVVVPKSADTPGTFSAILQ